MSVTEISARIEEIRVQMGLPTARSASTTSAGGTSFASTLRSTLDMASGATGAAVVEDAKRYLGVPYVFGGTNPATGLDCSGLVKQVYADLGITLPRLAKDQAKVGRAVSSLAEAKPGDLLAFNSPVDHIALYIGNNQMIAAPKPGDHVKIQNVYETPTAIRRVVDDAPAVGSAWSTASLVRPAALQSSASSASSSVLAGSVPYADLFRTAGAKHGISPTLLAAVAKVESGYNPSAVSKAGAQGLMQIMPSTARGLGVNAFDPSQAVDGAARLLKQNLREFGSLELALAAYNAGGGAVRKYDGIPPYAETQAYVPKVLGAMSALSGRGFA